jgi:hypothetical protein
MLVAAMVMIVGVGVGMIMVVRMGMRVLVRRGAEGMIVSHAFP